MASSPRIIIGTGPLVAFLRSNEVHHAWTVAQFKQLPAPFLTCEPVLTETAFLLSRQGNGLSPFFELLGSGLLKLEFSLAAEREALAKLSRKYKDLPMSLADACLVRMAERFPETAILTLDSHFRVYRKNGRQALPVVIPATVL